MCKKKFIILSLCNLREKLQDKLFCTQCYLNLLKSGLIIYMDPFSYIILLCYNSVIYIRIMWWRRICNTRKLKMLFSTEFIISAKISCISKTVIDKMSPFLCGCMHIEMNCLDYLVCVILRSSLFVNFSSNLMSNSFTVQHSLPYSKVGNVIAS